MRVALPLRLKRSLLIGICLLGLPAAAGTNALAAPASTTEVVVTLSSPPLAGSCEGDRAGSASCLTRRESLTAEQRRVTLDIERNVPGARVRWRYRIVANGLAVSLPTSELNELARIRGISHVYDSFSYARQQTAQTIPENVSLIGAPSLWGPALEGAGNEIKIGIIDDGIDQTHPYFNPAGYTMPEGFPKGDAAYTTAKVIVARAFSPPGLDYSRARLPFDSEYSAHGTHVAGIAAGNADTPATFAGETTTVSGVAPRAYLGNYKAMSIPTEQFGLNGNSPEIVAAIEAAVADGMDVINLSLGEPEIDPHRDIVARAVDAAVDAGVVVVTVAGNEYRENGEGSVGSPGSAAKAITVGATTWRGASADRLAPFSSMGPTPYSLRMKPEVAAPGVNILSSVPEGAGLWDEFSGTSMASPHVAGAAALLLQRHAGWSPAQVKSALTLSGVPVKTSANREVSPLREGGGRIALQSADQPAVFASPQALSFGFLTPAGRTGSSRSTRTLQLADASAPGAAVGSCQVRAVRSDSVSGVSLGFPSSIAVPGALPLTTRVGKRARAGVVDGWIVLSCAGREQRVPFWLRVTTPQLGRKQATRISHAGVYSGDTSKRSAIVDEYRYPQRAPAIASLLEGPEQVFRFALRKDVQNFGVVVLSRAKDVQVSPRIVRGKNESRLAGLTALPVNVNPYVERFGAPEPAAGVLRPTSGSYAIVFDSTSSGKAGRFRFRLWINDNTPPKMRVLSRRADKLVLRITDSGAGVDPRSIVATIGSRPIAVDFEPSTGKATISTPLLDGKDTLVISASDYQESKNNENATALLPNTRELRLD